MSSDSFAGLTGQRALVTGSSSGIGRAIALELADAGADVILHCRTSREAAEEVAEQIRKKGRQSEVLQQDLAQTDQLGDFVESAWSKWGGLEIGVLNAGVDLLTGEQKDWDYSTKLQALWQIDVCSSIHLGRSLGQRMKQKGKGALITLGWDQSDRGMDGDSGELFAAAKNSVMGFTRSLALNLAPDVRANCVAPGWIKTAWGEVTSDYWQQRVLDETPLKRWGMPEDIARTVRFLCSEEASFITGQVINVNGGAIR